MEGIYSRITDDSEFGIEFDKNEKSDIQEFFANETVFLNGCTGFLGKCFVEKLLRGCPQLKKLYLMIRPLKEPAPERAKKYFQHVVFSKLRSAMPNFESKVHFMEGNLMEEDIGLAESDRNMIVTEVTMMIHNASNVKFDTEVGKSLRTNVYGTLNTLNLARDCKNLKLFTYVSTGYSHSYRQHIEEKCYPPPGDLKLIKDFIEADESCPGAFSEKKRYEAVKPWPNLYTFSKAAAESLVEKFAKEASFRCLIYRPTIVISTYNEPIPSWCGNANGPVAAVIGAGLGFLRVLYGGRYPLDFVPADMCTNALFAIMWDSVVNRPEKNEVLVYNYGSSTVKQMGLIDLQDYAFPRGYELPPSKRTIRPYYLGRTSCVYWFAIQYIFVHILTAVVGDIALMCAMQKPMLISLIYKISLQLDKIYFFVNGNWRIHIHETRKMWDRMSAIDKHLFYNDLRTLDWSDYCYHYWAGIRQYILKEPNDGGDMSYLKTFSILVKVYWIGIVIFFTCPIIIVWYYYTNWMLLLLVPFMILTKLICHILC